MIALSTQRLGKTMARRRIGLFSFNFLPRDGGQGRSFYQLFETFRDHPSLEVLAFSPHHLKDPCHRSTMSFVHRLPLAQLAFSLLLQVKLASIVRRERLEVVVLNGGPGGILLASRPPAPVVYCANHTYRFQAQRVPREAWKRLLVPWERRGYGLADRVVSISSSTRKDLEHHYNVPESDITEIPVGVDTELFRPLDLDDASPSSIFFLGRLDRRKGIDFLVETMPRVVQEIPDATLIVGGTGKLRAQLETRVQELGLAEHVRFLGHVPEQDLPLWYNRCTVQVVPSILEGLGIVALEALACGGLLVATEGSGLEDIVQDGVNGFLVPYGDQQLMADRLVELLSDPASHRSLRVAGRQTVEERFSRQSVGDRWQRLLTRTLDQRES